MALKNGFGHQPKKTKKEHHISSGISKPLVFVVIIIGIIFLMSVIFRVSVINVYGNQHYTKDEIINAVDIEEGDNLFFFDRFAAVSRVFAKLPYVEEVSVTRQLPNRVDITITESKAMAFITVGDEKWTIDHHCKILGKVAEDEEQTLIKISGLKPGTLLIGEQLTTESGETETVDYLTEVLSQIQDRKLTGVINNIDFSNKNSVSFDYSDKYRIIIGDAYKVEYKFGMFLSAASQLLEGDTGTIDVSSTMTAVFTPN